MRERSRVRAGLGSSFGLLWASSTVSALGDGLRRVALPLLTVQLTSDARLVALVAAAGTLPWLVVGLPAGALVDRWDRARTMTTVDLSRALVVAVLAAGAATGRLGVLVLTVLAFVLGCGEVLAETAAHALVPALVARDRLERANGRLQAGEVVTGQFAGQALGGVLFAVALAVPFAVDCATFLVSGLLIAGIHPRPPRPDPGSPVAGGRSGLWSQTWDGLCWLAAHALLRRLCGLLAVLAGLSGAFWASPRCTTPACCTWVRPGSGFCSPCPPPGRWPGGCSPDRSAPGSAPLVLCAAPW